MAPDVIEGADALAACSRELAASCWFALDTEFVRERTYFPKACLIQIATAEHIYCIDPLSLTDLSPLGGHLVDGSRVKILHAARQDLEIFFQLTGRIPTPVFDTQIAAALAGFPDQIGYAALVEALCGVVLEKAHTRADWSKRPLGAELLDYAADDVRYLGAIRDELVERLAGLDRLAWLEEECRALEDPALYDADPAQAWRRVKGAAKLDAAQLGALGVLAAWRETAARETDVPRTWLLRDESLVELARRRPGSRAELERIDGLSGRFIRRHAGDIVQRIAHAEPVDEMPEAGRLSTAGRHLAATLVALVRERAAATGVPAGLVATRREIDQAVCGVGELRIFSGWRAGLVGDEIRAHIKHHTGDSVTR